MCLSYNCIKYLKILFCSKKNSIYYYIQKYKKHFIGKKFMSKTIFFSNIDRYVDRTIIRLHLCEKPLGHNFKKENKVAIYTFLAYFYPRSFELDSPSIHDVVS